MRSRHGCAPCPKESRACRPPEGVKNILEYEVRLPMKMTESLPAEKFLDLRWVAEVKKELEQKRR